MYGVLNNPSNASAAIFAQYVWAYIDGLLVNRAGGGPGTANTGVVNVNSGADPYLTVDPTLELSGQGGVNQ